MALVSEAWPYLLPRHRRHVAVSYVLWLLWGTLGVHKLYLGKPVMAVLYFFTGGLFMVGWLLDLVTIPSQTYACNLRLGLAGPAAPPRGPGAGLHRWVRKHLRRRMREEEVMVELLHAAAGHDGRLTVTQGVLDTGLPFDRVQRVLSHMVQAGYVDVGNQPETGVVEYVFPELQAMPAHGGARRS